MDSDKLEKLICGQMKFFFLLKHGHTILQTKEESAPFRNDMELY